jgi:plasmid stabilization system protein ParE
MISIRWAEPAAQDFADTAHYVAGNSPQAASDFVERVDRAIGQLTKHPNSGRVVPELQEHSITRYREIVMTPWRLIYRHENDVVFVLAIIDGRRNVEDLLLRRLTRGSERRT